MFFIIQLINFTSIKLSLHTSFVSFIISLRINLNKTSLSSSLDCNWNRNNYGEKTSARLATRTNKLNDFFVWQIAAGWAEGVQCMRRGLPQTKTFTFHYLSLHLALSLALFLACYVNSLDGWSARSNLSVDTKRSRTHTNTDTTAADTSTNKHTHTLHYTNKRTHCLADNENKHSHLHLLNSSEFSASSFFEISIFFGTCTDRCVFLFMINFHNFSSSEFSTAKRLYIYISSTHMGHLLSLLHEMLAKSFASLAMRCKWHDFQKNA